VKRLAILGSTGSIGCSALSVVESHPDRLEVVALAAGGNAAVFAAQVERFRPAAISMRSPEGLAEVARILGPGRPPAHTATGPDGLVAVATHPEADLVLVACTGTEALEAVLAAIEAGKTIAIANKEVLVMAGALVMASAARRGVAVLPVDSEHNAVHQCLHGRSPDEVSRIVLTASGGPFRDAAPADLERVTPDEALRHPTWRMGPKITIDSATLMNKGLEVIEARWLFGVPAGRIDVLIHPQSIVHSMVELRDGSVIAQLGVTDMRLPIQYAFSYPERWTAALPPLDLARSGRLDFAEADRDRFPCLALAYRALEAGGGLPIVLNAANEVAVAAFLDRQVGFAAIPRVIERAMDAYEGRGEAPPDALAQIRAVDAWARRCASGLIGGLQLSSKGLSC
jgi:1-deoxy-D-xylulose-5-phosphate reductoisomerase